MTRLTSLTHLTPRQKRYLLAFDVGILTRVATTVGRSRTAVHLVFRQVTKRSPLIESALLAELNNTLRRMRKEQPPGLASAFPQLHRRKSRAA